MIFEGKILSEIEDDEIRILVIDHVTENQHLEYKLKLNYKTDEEKYEVLCDIASLANAGGGYLFVGIRDDGSGKAQKFESVDNIDRVRKSIQSLCVDHISERIDGIEWEKRSIDENEILVYRIPESLRTPHMVTFKNKTHFVTRYSDGKREMTIGEIRTFFADTNYEKRFSFMEEGIKTLLRGSERNLTTSLVKMIEEGEISELSLNDGEVISTAARIRFLKEIKHDPYFRITVTPLKTHQNLINVEAEQIMKLIKNPPNQRNAGWNMSGDYTTTKRYQEGLIRKGVMNDVLVLKQNGYMEFKIKIDSTFCWTQPEEEYKKKPRLYPYAVVEYPLSFLGLYKNIIDALELDNSYVVTMGYHNIKGYELYPHNPRSMKYKFPHNVEVLTATSVEVPSHKVKNDFVVDDIALVLLKYFYSTFGYIEAEIPFYDNGNKSFNIE